MIIKNLRKNFIINLSLILLIFLLDRISKIYVIFLDKKFLGSEIFSSKFLNIQLFWNEGIAFGLFSLKQGKLYNFLTIIIMILIILILYLAFKSNGIKKYSLLLIFGGAIGNLYDRIFYNAVPDFIDFHIGNFHWFIFNVADIFITIGVIFMILLEFTATNNKLKI
jgi:signal peptidase II